MTGPLRASGTAPRRKYRARTIDLAAGGSLSLRPDGTIEQRDAEGVVTATWTSADAEWAGHAIRFGIKTGPATIRPDGRDTHRGGLPGA
jgi:hypothetical protein